MKFSDYIAEAKEQYTLYVDKKQTVVLDDAPPWIDHRNDDYEKYVEVYIKVKDNDKDKIALLVGVNIDDGEYKVIDTNIHVDKDNKDLLKFVKLSTDQIEDLSKEEAETATS